MAQFAVAVRDFSHRQVHIVEKELHHASSLLEALSGKRCAWNAPVVGSDVFTQTCGVHADGDRKGDLYCNKLLPERFVRQRDYALGKLSGKASIDRTLELMGGELLSPELREKVLNFTDRHTVFPRNASRSISCCRIAQLAGSLPQISRCSSFS